MMAGGEVWKVNKMAVPEGIYYILSGVKGDTMGRREGGGVEEKKKEKEKDRE